jgi:hypothetical protein
MGSYMCSVNLLSIFLLVWALAINGQNSPGNVTLTGYDALQVYYDGFRVTLPNLGNGDFTDTAEVPPYTRLFAVRGLILNNCGGILASMTDDYMITGSDWKCTAQSYQGWFSLGFDDTEWPIAFPIGGNGVIPVCPNLRQFPDISANAKWIWTQHYLDNGMRDDVIFCRVYLPGCDDTPCENGGTCQPNQIDLCICPDGFTGTYCETNINECDSNPCLNQGTCHDGINGYTCECSWAYSGIHCETDITECASQPCQNDGTCIDDGDGFRCTCFPGFTGIQCETDIDECGSDPCQNGATCADFIDDYACYCEDGYSGRDCEIDIDECASNPCMNDGTCTDEVNGYTCICLPGHTGVRCEIGIDGCNPDPCLNGGICESQGPGQATCSCLPGFTGSLCETDIDDCVDEPCNNGGTCIDGINDFSCQCAPYYTSKSCDKIIPDCGPLLRHAPVTFPPSNGYHILCYISSVDDPTSVNTPCRNLIDSIPPLNYNSSAILTEGGNFGCYRTKDEPNSSACTDNYSQDTTLASCLSCTILSVCIRFPNTIPIN